MIPTTESVVPVAQRWAAGDKAAGNALVICHDPWIRYHAKREAMRWESVEDLAQEMRIAFVHASTRLVESSSNVETVSYLRKAMRNAIAGLRRHSESTDGPSAGADGWNVDCQRRGRLDGEYVAVDAGDAPCPPTQEHALELRQVLDGSRITTAQFDAVVSRYVLGDSEAEAANRCGVSPFVVRRAAASGLAAMREFAGVADEVPKARAITPYRETEARIVALLGRDGALTGQQIRAALGICNQTFWEVTTGMRKRGVMRTEGSNRSMRYMLSDGSEAVEAA